MIQKEYFENNYDILAEIGRGAIGIVYLAHDKQRNIQVAIKRITNITNNGKQNRYFEQELELIEYLTKETNQNRLCKFVVQQYGYCREQDECYIISEYCFQGDLYSHMQRYYQFYTIEIKLEFLIEIITGIEQLHAINIVHRDLKPENILITQDQSNGNYILKITDFGISSKKEMDSLVSQVGTVVYMAPEIIKNEKYDNKVDIWSFGCIASEIMTNKEYFTFVSDVQTIKEIRNFKQYKTQGLECNEIENVIALCLQANPHMRPNATNIKDRLINIQQKMNHQNQILQQQQQQQQQQYYQYQSQQQNQQQNQNQQINLENKLEQSEIKHSSELKQQSQQTQPYLNLSQSQLNQILSLQTPSLTHINAQNTIQNYKQTHQTFKNNLTNQSRKQNNHETQQNTNRFDLTSQSQQSTQIKETYQMHDQLNKEQDEFNNQNLLNSSNNLNINSFASKTRAQKHGLINKQQPVDYKLLKKTTSFQKYHELKSQSQSFKNYIYYLSLLLILVFVVIFFFMITLPYQLAILVIIMIIIIFIINNKYKNEKDKLS